MLDLNHRLKYTMLKLRPKKSKPLAKICQPTIYQIRLQILFLIDKDLKLFIFSPKI